MIQKIFEAARMGFGVCSTCSLRTSLFGEHLRIAELETDGQLLGNEADQLGLPIT